MGSPRAQPGNVPNAPGIFRHAHGDFLKRLDTEFKPGARSELVKLHGEIVAGARNGLKGKLLFVEGV